MKKAILLLFGLFLFLILLEAGLRLGGFMMLSMQEYRNTLSIRQKGTYRILCLGESTTQNQWPPYLEKILNGKHMGIGFSVIDRGMTGTNTSAILNKVESYVNEYHPDMVVAMMGVNDFALHMPYDKPDSSKTIAFVRSLRTYKLARLLWLHMENKIKSSYARPEKANADIKTPAFSQRNEGTPVEISQLYRDRGQFRQAEECIKKALELSPENDGAYVELGWIYHDMGQFPQAEECVKKALELNPRNDGAYVELGWLYHYREQFLQAEESFKKALEINPRNDWACAGLGKLYGDRGQFRQAEEYIKKALEINPKNDEAYNPVNRSPCNPATACNYNKLKEILDKGNIKLVCVQYPLRNIEPLRKIFQGNRDGILFIDNEKIFKDAVKQGGYKMYFKDAFAGDFGHCTDKGNQLLAEHIADEITNKVFHK